MIIGIDIGLSGGLAFLRNNGQLGLVVPMLTRYGPRGETEIDASLIWDLFLKAEKSEGLGEEINLAVMEDVHPMPRDSRRAVWSFAQSTGKLKALVEVLGVPCIHPTPQAWKRVVLEGTKKDKDAAIGFVQGRFPGVNLKATPRCTKLHDGMADALCLACYGYAHLYGSLKKDAA